MPNETINQKISEEVDKLLEDVASDFSPTNKEKEIVGRVFNLFRITADNRNLAFDYFDGRNLKTYIEDSVKRFFTTIDKREDIEDWQARVFDPFTRNKVMAILGKIAQAIPKSEFIARGTEDFRREQILSDLVQYSEELDDNEELMFFALLEGLVKGTMIGYEGYDEKERAVRDIQNWNSGDEITLKEGKVKTKKVYGAIIPLEDFYPSSVGVRKIKDMPYCFWRTVLPLESFRMHFSKYDKAKFVQPASDSWTGEQGQRPFYLDFISDNVMPQNVEVIRFYNQDTDEFVVMANGIWLNSVGKKEDVMPIPFNHKTLPFWKTIYEPLGADFFYGKSLPDKLKPMQDVLNVLHNMMLDQGFLSIFSPILVSGTDDIEDDFLRPGRRIPVDDPNAYKQLQISTPGGFHQWIYETTKRILEETSVDPVSQGVAGTGERVTATEINRAAAGAISILGLFQNFVKFGVRDKARLRAKNVLQFYKAPLIEGILGEGGSAEAKKAFNTFKIEDTTLTSGKRGTKIIEMFKTREEMPTRTELRTRAKITEKETGRRVERMAINPDYLRNFEFDVKLVANPKATESKSMEKALWFEKVGVYMNFFGDFVDREELALQGAELFGDRPEKIFKKEMISPLPQPMPAGQGGGTGLGANMIRGQMQNSGIMQGQRSLKQMLPTA